MSSPPHLNDSNFNVHRIQTTTFKIVIFSILIPSIFGLNLFYLMIYSIHKSLRNCSNTIMVSLSILYIIGSILVTIQIILENFKIDPIGNCIFLFHFRWMYPLIMNFHICLLCFDRYYAVFYPYRYRVNGTIKTAIIAVMIVWILAFISMVPFTIQYGGTCNLNAPSKIFSYIFPIEYFIPSVIILITYGRAFCISSRHIDRIHPQNLNEEASPSKRKILQKNRKCIVQVVLTFGSYIALYYPIITIKMIQLINPAIYENLRRLKIPAFLFPLSYLYAAIHPIIFMCYNQNVRLKVVLFFRRKFNQKLVVKSGGGVSAGTATSKRSSKNINA